jgi:hypothetical protein
MGQAFSFDGLNNGVSDGVLVDASSNLDVGTGDGFTIGAWINPSDLLSRPVVEYNNGSGSGGDGVHLWASYPNQGKLYANIKDNLGLGVGSDHAISSGPIITSGTFQHVAVTYDATSGDAKLYRNGVEVASANFGMFTPETTNDLYIGDRPADAYPFSGQIDEVVLYDRVLDPSELQAIYDDGNAVLINSGDPTTTSPTVTLTLTCHDEQSGCERIVATFANPDANVQNDEEDVINEIPIQV